MHADVRTMNSGIRCSRHNKCHLFLRRVAVLRRVKRAKFSSCSSSTDDEDFLRNEGLVEGVWVFCRHGDRTPCRSLCAPHMVAKETAFWASKLPYPDAVTAFKALSETFRPDIHPSNNEGKFFDVERRPYGFLTEHGMDQMRTNGRRFHTRYVHHGYHSQKENIAVSSDDNGFMQSWDVRSYSTNYLRTVLSVQCFLDGLLGTNSYDPEVYRRYAISSQEDPEESLDHQMVGRWGTNSMSPRKEPKVVVQVRERAKDTLNAFDRNPDLMRNLVADVITSPKFIETDARAAPLAARLANFLPGLGAKGRNTFGGPSGINWIDATDHFVCRSAHGLKFSRFSDFEHDDRVEQTLSAMAHQTLAHLAWRFRQWYQSPPLLATIAAPPLREMATQLQATPALGVLERRPFVVYSCHDVTILSLLYGVGAEFLADEERGEWRFWPSYASTLVFELVRVQKETGPDSHVVRIFLNGKPVRAVNLLDHDGKGEPEYTGKGPSKMLRISDFVEVVKKLETAGGLNYSTMIHDDSESERDMSGWTG